LTNQRQQSDSADSAIDSTVTSSSSVHLHNSDAASTEHDPPRLTLELQSSHPVRQADNKVEVMTEQTGDQSDIYRRNNNNEEGNLKNMEDRDETMTSSSVSLDAGKNVVSSVNTSTDESRFAADDTDRHHQGQGQDRNTVEEDADDVASHAARDVVASKTTSRDKNIEKSDESKPAPPTGDNDELTRRDRVSSQSDSTREERRVETFSEGLIATGNTDEGGRVFTNDMDSVEADSGNGRSVLSRMSDSEGQSVEEVSESRREQRRDVEGTQATDKGLNSKKSNGKSSLRQSNSGISEDARNVSLSSRDEALPTDVTRLDRADVADNPNDAATGTASVDDQQGVSNAYIRTTNDEGKDDGSRRDKADNGGTLPSSTSTAKTSSSWNKSIDSKRDKGKLAAVQLTHSNDKTSLT